MLLEFPAMRAGFLSILIVTGLAIPFRNSSPNGAICLFDSTDIHIKNNLTAVVKVHRAFEIKSEAGFRFARVIIPINDYIETRDVKGYTELPGGSRIKLTRQDVGTSSAPSFKGFGDAQVVTFSLRTPVIGSRIYYEYKQVIKSLLYLPRVSRNTGYPVDRMVVTLRWDKKARVRYDSNAFEVFPDDRKIKFIAANLPEHPEEPFSCPDDLRLNISSPEFEYNKVRYSSYDWSDVGQFFARLSAQPQEFEDELRALAGRLIARAYSRQESLTAIYNFLADSVSYLALEMGKGDFTPHSCSMILNRRFGDCKDQAVLLSSLCRAAGLDAYPALISTKNFQSVNESQPWPTWFDHVITVVKDEAGFILLDPSDPLGSVENPPPRLRGKSYLICDGISGLSSTPAGGNPASTIIWQFYLSEALDQELKVDFSASYIGDAARAYRGLWLSKTPEDAASAMQAQLRYAGWDVSYSRESQGFELGSAEFDGDTLVIAGSFRMNLREPGQSRNLVIASLLNAYLLDNIFEDVRGGNYCGAGSIRLQEIVVVDLDSSGLIVESPYSDTWKRRGIDFLDKMNTDARKAIYNRTFEFSGENIAAADYNAFRDFLLSRIDQQYVRFQR
jgi:transglutaminase-like putative cysteine protease